MTYDIVVVPLHTQECSQEVATAAELLVGFGL